MALQQRGQDSASPSKLLCCDRVELVRADARVTYKKNKKVKDEDGGNNYLGVFVVFKAGLKASQVQTENHSVFFQSEASSVFLH